MGMIRRTPIGFKHTIPSDRLMIGNADQLLAFANKRGLKLEPPIEIEHIADLLDINIDYTADLHEYTSGILQKLDDIFTKDYWTIFVNASHHPNRQRYTIAHELGHYCLHKHQEKYFECDIFFRNLDLTKTEKQANKFAMELLMPEELLSQQINNGIVDVDELAQLFGVSTLALRIHARENLGYTEKKTC